MKLKTKLYMRLFHKLWNKDPYGQQGFKTMESMRPGVFFVVHINSHVVNPDVRNPAPPGMYKNPVNNGTNYQPQQYDFDA